MDGYFVNSNRIVQLQMKSQDKGESSHEPI